MLKFTATVLLLGVIWSSAKAECDESMADRPHVWIDDVPGCEAEESHCDLFGMEHVCNASFGDEICSSGTKVLCQVEPAVTLADPTANNILTMITYNIYDLRYTIWQDGQRERTCRVLFRILETVTDIDVIVFNELFMGGCFGDSGKLDLRDLLSYHGFHFTATVGENGCLSKQLPEVENGGVVIASRWPILEEREKIFENYPDIIGGTFQCKGVMYAKIEKNQNGEKRPYHIFGTHMLSFLGEEYDVIRVAQATEISDFMKGYNIPQNEPVIFAGDFNADAIQNPQNSMDVLNAMNALQPKVVGMYNYTFDRISNDLRFSNGTIVSWLDYVAYSKDHLLPDPDTSTIEVLRLRDDPFKICKRSPYPRHAYPDTGDCNTSDVIRDLSDHYAVKGVMYFPQEVPPVDTAALSAHNSIITLGVVLLGIIMKIMQT